MTNTVFQRFKLNISSVTHQQAVAEHWDLPNTEIYQSKDVASVMRIAHRPGCFFGRRLFKNLVWHVDGESFYVDRTCHVGRKNETKRSTFTTN
jgi:hypothetical protein